MPAQPGSVETPAVADSQPMNSRLVSAMTTSSLACGGLRAREVRRQGLELVVGVALGLLVHDRRRALAGLEVLQRLQQVAAVLAREAGRDAADAAAVGAVARE